MSENIELQSYCISQNVEIDSEEYHEIDQASVKGNNIILQTSLESPGTQSSFFTQSTAKSKKKKGSNAKKHHTSNNILELIKCKIDHNCTSPVIKNAYNVVNKSDKSSYLQKLCRVDKLLQVKPKVCDMERGLSGLKTIQLMPRFPNIEKLSSTRDNIFVQYMEPYSFKDLISENLRSNVKQTEKFLDVYINKITFTHHHDFSLETILTIQLEKYYEDYIAIDTCIIEILQVINVNRQTRHNLIEKFTIISPLKKDGIRFDSTILKYTTVLLESKEKYFKKVKEKRQLVKIILSIWSDIKNVRNTLATTKTAHVLEEKSITLNEETFSEKWNYIFQTEYSDMLIKLEYNYITEYLDYKEAKRRNVKNKLTKPKLHINPDEIKTDVEKIVNNLICQKDIVITLHLNNGIVSKSNHKIMSEMHDRSIYFKVFVDDVFACESERVKIDNFLNIDYNDYLTLQILQNNQSLGLILCESSVEMSGLRIHISEISNKSSSAVFTEKDFIYHDKIVAPTIECVGSGFNIKDIAAVHKIRLKSGNLFKGKLYTRCKIKLKLAWNDKLSDNQSSSIKNILDIEKKIKKIIHKTEDLNLNSILELINNIYEYEVEDDNIIKSLKVVCQSTNKNDDTVFIEENVDYTRFKLLKLRNNGGFSNTTHKSIPMYQSQISTEQLSFLTKFKEKDFDVDYFEYKCADMDPFGVQRYMGIKFVEKLNKKIFLDLNERLLRKTHKDVVNDYQDLSLRSIFSNKSNLSLGISSSITRKQSIEDGALKEQEIEITILRAFNLFDRRTEAVEGQEHIEECSRLAGYKVRLLRPFAKINYHSESKQTPIAIGSHPTWNYTMKIKSKLEPLSSIYINIYDENKVNINQDLDGPGQSFRYRCYNNWLGTLAIPIHTVLNLGSLRGTFKLTTPPIGFGYENESKESTSILPEIIRLMRKDTAFLTLRITTSLSHLGGLQFYNQPTDNDDPVIKHLNNFVTVYLNAFPTRNLSLTFIDSAGNIRCVTEFIQPLALPEITLNETCRIGSSSKEFSSNLPNINDTVFTLAADISRTINLALRYVSLIPTYEIAQSHVVTLNGIELLKVLYGSPLDHTLLLSSYLISIGLKCWIVIGYGLPRGLSSYALVKYEGSRIVMALDRENRGFLTKGEYGVFIFDAVNGEKYDIRDVGCPLKTVSYVFDNENIWVNMQSCQDCESLSFDFTKSSNWQQVFNDSVFVVKQPAIKANVYSIPGNTENLRNNLEIKLKTKIQKWRWNMKTVWNRYLSNLLRETLQHWECWSFNTSAKKPALGHKLKQLMATYKMFGFPLNVPYVTSKSVISKVKSTLLHVNDDPYAEFGLAVEVFAYPNNVLSVWVFFASITRK